MIREPVLVGDVVGVCFAARHPHGPRRREVVVLPDVVVDKVAHAAATAPTESGEIVRHGAVYHVNIAVCQLIRMNIIVDAIVT